MKKRRDFTEVVVSDYEKQAVIAKSSLCKGMDNGEVQFIAPYFHCYHVDEGSTIYCEGDVEAFLCLIVSGSVNVIKGFDKIISNLGVGETVGEMTIIDERPRSASAVAASEGVVYAITRSSLSDICAKSMFTWSKLYCNIAVSLSLRLRQTSDLLAQHMTSSSYSPSSPQANEGFHPFLRKMDSEQQTIL